jgi:hypothetical protein
MISTRAKGGMDSCKGYPVKTFMRTRRMHLQGKSSSRSAHPYTDRLPTQDAVQSQRTAAAATANVQQLDANRWHSTDCAVAIAEPFAIAATTTILSIDNRWAFVCSGARWVLWLPPWVWVSAAAATVWSRPADVSTAVSARNAGPRTHEGPTFASYESPWTSPWNVSAATNGIRIVGTTADVGIDTDDADDTDDAALCRTAVDIRGASSARPS